MKNAHLRFGSLTYVKTTEKTTTSIKLRLDRFIGEALPDPPRQAIAHLISVIGGDTQIAAVSAAISLGDKFMVEGPDVQPIRVCLERNAQCFKGSVQLAGRKKPLRHLIALSEDFASSNVSAGSGRTLLASSENRFIWASIAHIHGIPGVPDWANWFASELQTHRAIVLVNEALVREFMPQGNPIGHHLLVDGQAHEIVGVVADVRGISGAIAAEPGPAVYWPANTHGGWHRYFMVRTNVPPEQLANSIREQVYQADPRQSVGEIETMDQLLSDAVEQPRLNAAVVASFAGIALLLACVGIYGVVSHFAAQRTQEIGVRMALGATRGDITRLFVRRVMVPAAIGLAAGSVVSLAANRLLRSQLYGVQPNDLRLYLASLLVLLAPLLVAILRPAILAGKTEPMEALRTE